jgi:dienelactone hydrolase
VRYLPSDSADEAAREAPTAPTSTTRHDRGAAVNAFGNAMLDRSIRGLAFAAALALSTAAVADDLAVVPPRVLTGYDVGCSNVEQDPGRIRPGETAADYWEGIPGGGSRYVTDLLLSPQDTPTLQLRVPSDFELFGVYLGRTVPQVLLICYPTPAGNPAPAYALPGGNLVPHMQRGAQAPLFADANARYPVMLFSHGLGGSPLSSDYLDAIVLLASQGYVVVAPFHADARVVDIKIEDANDLLRAIANFASYTAMQAVRPLTLRAAIDYVLESDIWRDHVDPGRIVGFGASLGGESMMLLAGAELTTSVAFTTKAVVSEPRLKAAVGYVPYFGQDFFPSFGRDQHGVDRVTTPYLAIVGTEDRIAPAGVTAQGMARLTHSRVLVALQGVGHYLDRADVGDVFTWTLAFLEGHAGDGSARAQAQRMVSVAGGADDRLLLDYIEPSPPAPAERMTVEFYNGALDHYFITAEPAEVAMLDEGIIVPGWQRTGFAFKAWARESGTGSATCRFFGTPGIGPNSHFFTVDPTECALVRANPLWHDEGLAFNVHPATGGTCPAGFMLVTRLYNNGQGGQANHRYLTSRSEINRMRGLGWYEEGPVFCTPP